MREESACKPAQRYLRMEEILSDSWITTLREGRLKNYNENLKNSAYHRFISWQRSERELVVYTHRAYADIAIPKQYDIVFNEEDSTDFVSTPVVVDQVLIGGWRPWESIEDGYGHTCILQFENRIPDIFDKLTFTQDWNSKFHASSPRLGLCSSSDFEEIARYRIAWLAFKDEYQKKYGPDWINHMGDFENRLL